MLTLNELAYYLETHADEPLTLRQLSEKTGLSSSHLQRRFKREFGVSPREFQAAARVRRLKSGLRGGKRITDAVYTAGYGSGSRLYEQADTRLGMTPSAYRAGGAGEVIHHACRRTSLGWLMMAATGRGVCFVQFGDSQATLQRLLTEEFPRAELRTSSAQHSPQLDDWLQALESHLATGSPSPDVPLDLRGTAFQVLVWRFLAQTGRGEVLTYQELARGIGRPKAVRAAASACAANRIAVLVPCHRVLRSDGGAGGYRWGVERKRALLQAERRDDPAS